MTGPSTLTPAIRLEELSAFTYTKKKGNKGDLYWKAEWSGREGKMKQAHLGLAEGKNGQSEDEALQKARKIAKALIDDEGLLNTLAKVGIAPEELVALVESIGR